MPGHTPLAGCCYTQTKQAATVGKPALHPANPANPEPHPPSSSSKPTCACSYSYSCSCLWRRWRLRRCGRSLLPREQGRGHAPPTAAAAQRAAGRAAATAAACLASSPTPARASLLRERRWLRGSPPAAAAAAAAAAVSHGAGACSCRHLASDPSDPRPPYSSRDCCRHPLHCGCAGIRNRSRSRSRSGRPRTQRPRSRGTWAGPGPQAAFRASDVHRQQRQQQRQGVLADLQCVRTRLRVTVRL